MHARHTTFMYTLHMHARTDCTHPFCNTRCAHAHAHACIHALYAMRRQSHMHARKRTRLQESIVYCTTCSGPMFPNAKRACEALLFVIVLQARAHKRACCIGARRQFIPTLAMAKQAHTHAHTHCMYARTTRVHAHIAPAHTQAHMCACGHVPGTCTHTLCACTCVGTLYQRKCLHMPTYI